MTEPPVRGEPGQKRLFEMLEALEYVARHDGTVVVIRDGRVEVDPPASKN